MNDDAFDRMMKERILQQENSYPDPWPTRDALWKLLNERRSNRKAKQRRILWRVAAAVLLTVLAGTFFLHNKLTRTMEAEQSLTILSAKEQDAMSFIARYCAEKNISCSTPVIQELRTDLEQSFRKLDEINGQLQRYGDDTELVRTKERIETHQARLIKIIVQTL